MQEEQPTERHPDLVPTLQCWHSAKEQARRYNRNLLQYAGGAIALLGVAFGTGAVFAVASGVDNSSTSKSDQYIPWEALASIGAVIGLIVFVLLCFLVRAFLLRGAAERDAAGHLHTLIAVDPDRVWSSEE